MKKLLIVPILALVVSTAFAQTPEKTGSLLWRISGNNLAQPSYVFGTHHLFPLSFLETVSGLNSHLKTHSRLLANWLWAMI